MHCCVCDDRITGTGWVCHDCAKEHDLKGPVSSWPVWAKALRISEKQCRRQDERDAGRLWNIADMDDLYPHERGVGEAWDYLINDMGIDNPDARPPFRWSPGTSVAWP